MVKNTGNFDGAEVSQLYIHQVNSPVLRPYKELKAFSKNFIKAGASQVVNVQLNRAAFEYYKTEEKKFDHDPGKFEILIGTSSDHILLKGIVDVSK
jgi:beta-glucosidase